ncbi:hypothetical protein [Huintestinicola sp.]|uniref:hypothetical protein n=1 Tax=Huintestinicola sp. TaxID=2981661 RepID=UPI003D7C3BC9
MGGELIRNCKNGFAETDVHIRGDPPDKIVKVSDNEVYAVYGSFKQTWTADGSGNERHNFSETIEEGEWL